MAKKPTIESVDASLTRWKTRLKRAITMINKLEKQKRRMEKAAVQPPTERVPASTLVAAVKGHIARSRAAVQVSPPADRTVDGETTPRTLPPPAPKPDIDTDIPEFLRRGAAAQKAVDEVIADQIRQEQADTKKKKAQGRIAKMKAKQSGETKKMPLSGKAALEYIKG